MNDFNYDNEIIEIDNSESIKNPEEKVAFEEPKPLETIKKEHKSLKEKWINLDPKKRRAIIILSVILLLVIFAVVIYFVFFKKEEVKEPEEETVILEKDNYRYENGNLLFLDKSDRVIGEYECTNKDPEKCLTMKADYSLDTLERVISTYENGDEIVKSSQIYLDKYVFITDGKESNLYDIKSKKKLLNIKNYKVYGTDRNLVVIANEDEKYGLIEINDEGYNYLIRPSYDNLGIVSTKNIFLVALDKDKTYLIDKEGKKISSNISGTIKTASDKYIVVLKNKTYNLYSYDNEELISDYDYIGLNDDLISLVKNNRLYLRDNDLNKLNEDGIRLSNSDYVRKYIYDNDNKLKETKKSYDIAVQDNIAMVTVDSDIKNINILEGKVSKNYDYLSYYDGKLYFYNDEEKDDVLGTYTCKNKNEITNADSKLEKCMILTTIDGYTGIYNNNIVLLYDNNNSDTIYTIYSLKDKAVKGTYSYLEIVNSGEINSNIKHIGTSTSYLIAQTNTGNNKGNYGVLEINTEKIKGKIAFDYQSIKKENDYYLFKNLQGLISIYNKSFSKISNDFAYIELLDKYYVGIINNKLNVYSYLNKNNFLEKDIDVTDNKYEISVDNGFVIKSGDQTYNFDSNGKLIAPKEDNIVEDNTNNEEENGDTTDEG